MFELASAGLGLIGSIGKMISRGKANKEMGRLIKSDPVYSANPIAQQRLGLAQTLLNARSPGAAQAERNIYSSGANANAMATRAATDSSQLLATAGNIQGNTNQAFNNLGSAEAQDYQRRFGNYTGAQEGVINEQDKVFQDSVRRFGDEAQIRGGQAANNANNWGDISNLGFGLMDFGAAGGFNNWFGQTNRGVENSMRPITQRVPGTIMGTPNRPVPRFG